MSRYKDSNGQLWLFCGLNGESVRRFFAEVESFAFAFHVLLTHRRNAEPVAQCPIPSHGSRSATAATLSAGRFHRMASNEAVRPFRHHCSHKLLLLLVFPTIAQFISLGHNSNNNNSSSNLLGTSWVVAIRSWTDAVKTAVNRVQRQAIWPVRSSAAVHRRHKTDHPAVEEVPMMVKIPWRTCEKHSLAFSATCNSFIRPQSYRTIKMFISYF